MMAISLKQTAAGDWNIRRKPVAFFSELESGAVICLAREVPAMSIATGAAQMSGPALDVVLASYPDRSPV